MQTEHTLSALEVATIAALGDRLMLLRKLLTFLRSLNLDFAKLAGLVREAIGLFDDGFSLEKLLAFVEKLVAVLNPAREGTAGALVFFPGDLKDLLGELAELARVLKLLLG